MRSPRSILRLAIFSVLLCGSVPLSARPAADRVAPWAILISGSSGDPGLQQEYLKQLKEMGAILGKLGFPPDHIAVLFDDPSRDSAFVQHKSTREELQNVCRSIAAQAGKDDLLFVLILGHGSMEGEDYKLNLVGPDPTGSQLAAMLDEIPGRSIIVNTTNCSGGSLPALSKKGRIVITATRSGNEKNQTHFAEHFIQAFQENKADTDKDGRVSILEAFRYAGQMVQAGYSSEGTLQTEHPQLNDSGDGKGESNPSAENGQGLLARITYMDSGGAGLSRADMTQEEAAMTREAESLQKQIETLKYAKSQMSQDDYEKKLEELLLKLAQINAKLRKKQ